MTIPKISDHRIKGEILRILRQDQKATAESLLCREVRITPESLRKQILELQEAGYEIQTSDNGFQLIHEPDNPYPWEFPGREPFIHYFKELPSTMDVARKMAGNGCPDFTVVISEFQSTGRGRLQRTWHSDAGGLYFTIVLRPRLAPVHSHCINFAASLVLAKVLQRIFQVDAKVKWPNDILVNELKLSGMLSEMGIEANRLSYVNIGIGINVNNDPTEKEPNAISLKKLLGTRIDRRRLLSSFLDDFQTMLSVTPLENIIPQWKQHTMTIGRHVKIVTIKESYEGFARDVSDSGALILEQKDGSLIEVIYGDCFHG
ncbi:MAG: biotin--[acetyl-CoA-carboxylase] ligase [Desulfobacterium sp.]|nr:biotin--[acetyl-CoA-carboxylase] ligase [Desulfobacterium sp.]